MARKPSLSAESAAIVAHLRKFGPQTRQKLTEVVPTDTPGGLAKRLSNLRACGWVQRELAQGLPDLYSISPSARGLFPELDARPAKAAATSRAAASARASCPATTPKPQPVERYVPGLATSSSLPRMSSARPGAHDFLGCPSRGVRC